jgi:beta-glucosidase
MNFVRTIFVQLLLLGVAGGCATAASSAAPVQPDLGVGAKPELALDGLRFKDLNGDGRLQPYEDWRRSPEARADDLVTRMTLDEKAAQMMHGTAPNNWPTPATSGQRKRGYYLPAAEPLIGKGIGSFITRLSGDHRFLAEENNKLQDLAERTRLGVPLIISTDPRNHFSDIVGLSNAAEGFSQWPETLGFAAIGDEALTRRFGDLVRQEYRAAGIQQALSPQADLATEPRWPRVNGTFGEDAELTGRLVAAYVRGFQGGERSLAANGVATVVKHWVGYGAAKDGWDSHSDYGRYADITPRGLAYHLKPWDGAFAAGAAGVMPTYSILEGGRVAGAPLEPVGAGFSRQLLAELLRGRYGFRGVILSDWGITNDCPATCRGEWRKGQPPSIGMPWGVEELTRTQRFAKAVEAGIDQFGGTTESERLVEAVRSGLVPEQSLNDATRRILTQKFQLGLFENPYASGALARAPSDTQMEADRAQSRSLVVLENRRNILPLKRGAKVFLRGVSAEAAGARGLVVVATPEEADVAIVRMAAPYQTLHPNYFFGQLHHEGDLDFKDGDAEYEALKAIAAKTPTVLTVYLDRPAVLTQVKDRVAGLVGNFGVSDGPLLDGLTGVVKPEGRLPFELPSSMDDVRAQRSDLPHDTARPLYPIFFSRR